jgi:hypothetical protein
MGASAAKSPVAKEPAVDAGTPRQHSRGSWRERHCPDCGKSAVRRSRRRTLKDYVAALVGLRPYRCHECNHRYHDRSRARRPPREPYSWRAVCPRCGFTGVNRIPRRKVPPTWGNLPWRMLPAYAYRCPECRKRFFDYRPPERKD